MSQPVEATSADTATAPEATTRAEIKRYVNHARKVRTTKTRTAFRYRTKKVHTQRTFTPAERQAKKKERIDNKKKMQGQLEGAIKKLHDIGEDLAQATGKHTGKYWVSEILRVSKMRSERQVTTWNAFVSQEVTESNKGEQLLHHIHVYSLPIPQKSLPGSLGSRHINSRLRSSRSGTR